MAINRRRPKSVKEAERPSIEKTVNRLMENEDGRDFLRHLCNECGPFRLSFVEDNLGATDLYKSVYCEGRRSVWLEVRKLIPVDKLHTIEHYVPPSLINNEDDTQGEENA